MLTVRLATMKRRVPSHSVVRAGGRGGGQGGSAQIKFVKVRKRLNVKLRQAESSSKLHSISLWPISSIWSRSVSNVK